jgi:hypothetical protein
VDGRRISGVVLIVLIVLGLALVALRGCSDPDDEPRGESSTEETLSPTTFPEPPSGAGEVTEETEGTLTKTSFSTADAPGAVLDSYLANFARIGWTTLSDERAGDTATLSLQGGNRYAVVRAVSDGATTSAVVCTGVDQEAVFQCASASPAPDAEGG